MTEKVVSLHGAHVPGAMPRKEGQKELVDRLKEMLKAARDGQLVGVTYGLVHANRDLSCGWCGTADSHDMIAVTSLLGHRVIWAATEDDGE